MRRRQTDATFVLSQHMRQSTRVNMSLRRQRDHVPNLRITLHALQHGAVLGLKLHADQQRKTLHCACKMKGYVLIHHPRIKATSSPNQMNFLKKTCLLKVAVCSSVPSTVAGYSTLGKHTMTASTRIRDASWNGSQTSSSLESETFRSGGEDAVAAT